MNKFTKWIVNKLGGVDPADVKPREITLASTKYNTVKVGVTIINISEDDINQQHYGNWEKELAARGIGNEIINNGLFERVEMHDDISNTIRIKYNVEVLKKGCNNGEIDG